MRSAGETCFGKFIYKWRQRKAGMGAYLCMVPFISVLNFLHGFNGQFLMLYISGVLYSPISRRSSSSPGDFYPIINE
jgi:hypothetical protein